MKTILYLSIFGLFFSCNTHQQLADTIFINGNIYTMSEKMTKAEAIAVSGGKILDVSDNTNILKYKGDQTKIIDLEGKTMTPGFIDSHAHFLGLGYSKMNLDLMKATSYEEIVQKVQERVSQVQPGEWIVGRGWHQDKWDSITAPIVQGFPTHKLLSDVSPDNPVFFWHSSQQDAF